MHWRVTSWFPRSLRTLNSPSRQRSIILKIIKVLTLAQLLSSLKVCFDYVYRYSHLVLIITLWASLMVPTVKVWEDRKGIIPFFCLWENSSIREDK